MNEQVCCAKMRELMENGKPLEALNCYQEFTQQPDGEAKSHSEELFALVEKALAQVKSACKDTKEERLSLAFFHWVTTLCVGLIVLSAYRQRATPYIPPSPPLALKTVPSPDYLVEADRLYQSARYPEALRTNQAGYDFYFQQQNRPAMASALMQMGQVNVALGNLSEANSNYERALEIRKETGPPITVAQVQYVLGDLQRSMGDSSQSIANLVESLQTRTSLNDKMGVLECQRGLGNLYAQGRQFSGAKVWLNRALQGAKQENKTEIAAVLRAELGMVACELGNYTTARNGVREGLRFWKQGKHPTWIAKMKRYLSHIALKQGHYSEARTYAEQSLVQYRQASSKSGVAYASLALANVCAKTGEEARAFELYDSCLKYAYASGLSPLEHDVKAQRIELTRAILRSRD